MGYRLPLTGERRRRRNGDGKRRKRGRGFGVVVTFSVFVLFAFVSVFNVIIRQPQLFRPTLALWTGDLPVDSRDPDSRLLTEGGLLANATNATDLSTCEDGCAIHDDEGVGEALGYFAATLYFFLGIAIVCDSYFEPSLEKISDVLNLSEDVAGATFMAAGSSAPELFTSMGDTFGPANSIGIGTIVGSAMFNILVIVALSAAVANGACNIDWRPVARDVCFYTSSIFMLVIFFQEDDDGKSAIEMHEALIMVLGYFMYIVFMMFNQKIFSKCEKKSSYQVNPVDTEALATASKSLAAGTGEAPQTTETEVQKLGGEDDPKPEAGNSKEAEGGDDDDDDDGPFWIPPEGGPAGKILWFFALPFELAYFLTIPKIDEQRCGVNMEGWYVVAFVMSIGWIGVLCHFMVEWATAIGCIADISPVVMGVTVLSVGTSVPDAIGSMIVAKNGQADMAIANAIGSNVFDVLLGLGFPWLLYSIIRDKPFPVDAGGLMTAIIILLSTVGLFVGALFANQWKMNKTLGVMLFFLYLLYVAFTLVDALIINPEEDCTEGELVPEE